MLLFLTGGGDSLFYLLFFPLVAVNAYYFGPWVALAAALVAGGLYGGGGRAGAAVDRLDGASSLLAVLFGLPGGRRRASSPSVSGGARGEVERLNAELTGTLSRLQATQQELLVAERMATVGPALAEGRARGAQSDRGHRAERRDAAGHRRAAIRAATWTRPAGLVAAIRDQVTTLDALTEEYLAFARFPKPHFEEESINHLLEELADFVRPVATRQGLTIHVEHRPGVPMMEIDRGAPAPGDPQPREERHGGALARGRADDRQPLRRRGRRDRRCRTPAAGISEEVAGRLFEPFFTTKPQGTGPRAVHHAPDHRGARRRARAGTTVEGGGADFTIRLPMKRAVRHV